PKLNVLEVRSLGPRHALYVIGYEQQRFLLSSAPTGISMLANLPPATEAEAEPPAPAPPSFADALAKALSPKLGNGGSR
ncbi:MAG TPA: flagellar biosynthetic protein FliO, partial [Clostridia bacterium]|nr:flagellar biosynthetic protein FliO [Clostridia bacterium]